MKSSVIRGQGALSPINTSVYSRPPESAYIMHLVLIERKFSISYLITNFITKIPIFVSVFIATLFSSYSLPLYIVNFLKGILSN